MIKIVDGVIYAHHGNDGAIPVTITKTNKQPYILQEGDKLKFTVRERADHESPVLLETEVTENLIVLTHEMMEQIPVGKYSCDLQLTRANGMVSTIFPSLAMTGRMKNLKNFVVDAEVSD